MDINQQGAEGYHLRISYYEYINTDIQLLLFKLIFDTDKCCLLIQIKSFVQIIKIVGIYIELDYIYLYCTNKYKKEVFIIQITKFITIYGSIFLIFLYKRFSSGN